MEIQGTTNKIEIVFIRYSLSFVHFWWGGRGWGRAEIVLALLFVEVRRSSDCSYIGVIVCLGTRGALEEEICMDVHTVHVACCTQRIAVYWRPIMSDSE